MNKSLTPFSLTLYSTMIMSTLMALSTNNWLMLWTALEINMLSFIPLMTSSNMYQESEAMIKYFLIQSAGSSILLISSSMLSSMSNKFLFTMILLSMIMKLGMAPCHKWFPSVMTSISWTNCMILSSWQKLAPMSMMTFMLMNNKLMYIIIPMNAIIGAMMGMNQTKIKSIMAFSSMTHMSWMTSFMLMKKPIMSIIYLVIYSLIIIPMFMIFQKEMSLSNSTNSSPNNHTLMIMSASLLTISGIPPLAGFLPKWITINFMWSMTTIIFMLIMSTIMNLFFYLNLLFSTILKSSSMPITTKSPKILLLMSTSSLPMLILMMT